MSELGSGRIATASEPVQGYFARVRYTVRQTGGCYVKGIIYDSYRTS